MFLTRVIHPLLCLNVWDAHASERTLFPKVEQTEQTPQRPRQLSLGLAPEKFSATKYKTFSFLELFFSPHLSVGKVNSLLWKLRFGGLLRVILVARQKWVFLRSRLP